MASSSAVSYVYLHHCEEESRCGRRRKQIWNICEFLTPPLLPPSFTAPSILPHALRPNGKGKDYQFGAPGGNTDYVWEGGVISKNILISLFL